MLQEVREVISVLRNVDEENESYTYIGSMFIVLDLKSLERG